MSADRPPQSRNNLVLVGYRGSGKTTLGKLLASHLGFRYVSTDAEIINRAGMTIPEIVRTHSWKYFRDLEQEVVEDCAGGEKQVLDTGGGVVVRSRNIELLRGCGKVCFLKTEVSEIVERIGADTQRPSLTGKKSFTEEVSEVLSERTPLYRQAADFEVNTSRLSPGEAVREIIALCGLGGLKG